MGEKNQIQNRLLPPRRRESQLRDKLEDLATSAARV
jgi:hypothetical protein